MRPSISALFLAVLTAVSSPVPLAAQVAAEHLEGVRGRGIGPAGMSGRVAAVDVAPTDPNRIYVGAATGGVWRSTDAGTTWEPVFDEQPLLGVGAVRVFAGNPDVVWVGTGEANPRNSAGVGNGVYRSLDGGATWRHVGLPSSERISRILLHPSDPDVAWVAALGPAWSPGGDRGVFRTRDGGATWDTLLTAGDQVGAADLVVDPRNPDRLLAAMWEYRRWPWFFRSGGPGSGLYSSFDGGDSWRRQGPADGLPSGDLGRIGLAVARSAPNVAYALVEAERSVLLRSEDGGRSWATVSDRDGIAPRPFYYADLRVDPENENRLYSLHSRIEVSEDAGRTWATVVPSQIIHGDVQELWIDPSDGRYMIIGNDGGIGITRDRGAHWRFVENLPLAQFYHVQVDDAVPFNIYGGLQDNGSWFGPSTVWENRGILNAHWRRVGSGDGFSVAPDPSDPRYGYSMSQQGNLRRFDKVTGARKDIQPVHPDGEPLRFNWNAGFALDPHRPTGIYLGSQYLHRSLDRGDTWEILSPDLTTNDPEKQRQDVSGGLTLDATGAENHTTILSVAPSALERGLIWVGTDDGRIQLTRDDGATWSDVGPNVPDVPAGSWVATVRASRHDPARAYAVFDEHRRGDWTSYVFRTDDYGASWTSLAAESLRGFLHVVEEDPVEPGLLFVGGEFGLWASLNAGGSWLQMRSGVPPAPVRDLVVHPRDHDLVVATHGRGIYVVDDVRPLRALAAEGGQPPELPGNELRVFDPPPAIQAGVAEAIGYRSVGHTMFFGEMRPYGALVSWWVDPADEGASSAIEVRDASGSVVHTETLRDARPGVNRAAWNLTATALSDDAPAGPVLPGRYSVTVGVRDRSGTVGLDVLPDPRSPVSSEDRIAKVRALEHARGWIATLNRAEERLNRLLGSLDGIRAAGTTVPDALEDELDSVEAATRSLLESLFTGPDCQGICGGEVAADLVREPLGSLGSSLEAPTETDRIRLRQARAALDEVVAAVNEHFRDRVRPLTERVNAAGVPWIEMPEPLVVPGN